MGGINTPKDTYDMAVAAFNDSLNNYVANLGLNTNSVLAYGTYSDNKSKILTRDRFTLTNMYRSSWIVGKVVDILAEDMTKNGIEIIPGSDNVDVNKIYRKLWDLGIWDSISSGVKWGKLYGGAIGVIMIDGQDLTTPLNIDSVYKKSFKGINVFDRWQVVPSFEVVMEPGVNFGLPEYYDVYLQGYQNFDSSNGNLPSAFRVHHSRVIRFIGIELPYYEAIQELWWGESVVERLYDRILIFDSATYGASNLLLKSYLRVLSIDGLREAIAADGVFLKNLTNYINSVAAAQASTGIYAIDKNDTLETTSFTFTGMDKALNQFAEQLAGATGIPIVRLFGQPPGGFNSTGEIDLRSYFDTIKTNQRKYLAPAFNRLLPILYKSEFGGSLGDDWTFDFVPLWQPDDSEKAEIAERDAKIVSMLIDKGVFDREMSLNYLKDNSKTSGRYGSINKEDYAKQIDNYTKKDTFDVPEYDENK